MTTLYLVFLKMILHDCLLFLSELIVFSLFLNDQDPRDAPPPTRAETREERLERKVRCFSAYFWIRLCVKFFLDYIVYYKLFLEQQRREKMERRQAVVETELKLCKYIQHRITLTINFWLFWRQIFTLASLFTGDPHNDPNAQGDAFKTLFVARIVSLSFCICLGHLMSVLQPFIYFLLFLHRIMIQQSPNSVASLRSTAPSSEWVVHKHANAQTN